MSFVSLHSISTRPGLSTGCVTSDLPDLKPLGGARLFSSFTINAILVDSHTGSLVSVCALSRYLQAGGLVFVLEGALENKHDF